MATTRMLPNAVHFREFQNDPVTGHHYTGTCGETALATAMVCASPPIESTQQAIDLMMAMTREMMGLGWAGKPNGETTTAHLHDEAIRRGFSIEASSYISYQEPLDLNALHTLLLAEAGVRPIVLEVARAGNLNSYNGGNDEPGVQYHFICVVGIDPDGYWCNDGDNSAITQHLVLYPWSELEQARPCGVLVLNMQEASPVATQQPYDKVYNDAINAEKERDAALAELAQVKAQLAKVTQDAINAEQARDQASAEITDLKNQLAKAPGATPIPESVKTALQAIRQSLAPQVALAQEVDAACHDLGL